MAGQSWRGLNRLESLGPLLPIRRRMAGRLWTTLPTSGSSASQAGAHVLCKPKVHHRVHNSAALSLAKSIQSTSFHPISLRPVSKLYLGLSRRLFPQGFPIKTLYTFLFSSTCATKCPTGLILLELIAQLIFDQIYQTWTLSIQSLKVIFQFSRQTAPHTQAGAVAPCGLVLLFCRRPAASIFCRFLWSTAVPWPMFDADVSDNNSYFRSGWQCN
jgi:hypothetical protein